MILLQVLVVAQILEMSSILDNIDVMSLTSHLISVLICRADDTALVLVTN